MTPTTETATTTCAYDGCTRTATELDADGDCACPLHAAQSEEWTLVVDSIGADGSWIDAGEVAAVESRLAAHGLTVAIEAAGGRLAGLYFGGTSRVRSDDRRAELVQQAADEALDAVRRGAH